MYRWIFALAFAASVAHAQTGVGTAGGTGAAGTIDPGMTRAQVIERLGKPATVRNYQGSTYLMYSNNCGKKCGMQDIVILDHDVVVDAMFRSPNRHFTGTSSSPDATKPSARTQRNQPLAVPASSATSTTLPTLKGTTTTSVRTSVTTTVPAESTKTLTSYPPHDSAKTSTSYPPHDSTKTSTSYPPADSAPVYRAPPPPQYGKPPVTPPPADSAATSTSHPPVDNSSSSTSHPPKPPK